MTQVLFCLWVESRNVATLASNTGTFKWIVLACDVLPESGTYIIYWTFVIDEDELNKAATLWCNKCKINVLHLWKSNTHRHTHAQFRVCVAIKRFRSCWTNVKLGLKFTFSLMVIGRLGLCNDKTPSVETLVSLISGAVTAPWAWQQQCLNGSSLSQGKAFLCHVASGPPNSFASNCCDKSSPVVPLLTLPSACSP